MLNHNENIKTPYFVLDRRILTEEVNSCKRAIENYWPNTIIAYSVKTNSLPYLAKLLNEQGVYAEVVSEDEYQLVSLCGFRTNHIVCNGPIKSRQFIGSLMENHVMINIDSHSELLYVIEYAKANPTTEYGVGLRVNVDIEKYFPSESKAGEQGSRFGFCMENDEFEKAVSLLNLCPNLYINGLHLHVSTSTRKVDIYKWLSQLFTLLVKKYSLNRIEYFDIGGGFFGGLPNRPGWNDYLSAIAKVLTNSGFERGKIKLILEPGVSLLASAFSYYVSVVDVKQTNRSRFVLTDGSRIHIDPFFHKTAYFYEHIAENEIENSPLIDKQIVVGFTCLEYDNIMSIENKPEIRIGDIFRFDKLGAYTISLSPLFITYFPSVYVRENDGSMLCVRKKWTANEYVQLSNI